MKKTLEVLLEKAEPKTDKSYWLTLLPALQRLDSLLEEAVTVAETVYGFEAATDLYRGLYINQDEVESLLAREPGMSLFQINGKGSEEVLPECEREGHSSLAWLQKAYGLSDFDLDIILIALAPELDRRYERIYAYLQDNVSRRRPSVDLVLNLLCANAAERLERRVHFGADAPLIEQGLICLVSEPNYPKATLLAQTLKLDEQVVRLLLGQQNLDSRLISFCQWSEPKPTMAAAELPLNPERWEKLSALAVKAWSTRQPLRLYFHGPRGVGKRRVAELLAAEVGAPLLVVALSHVMEAKIDFEPWVRLLFREAFFQRAIVYLDRLEVMQDEGRTISEQILLDALAQDSGIAILSGTQPWQPEVDTPLGVVQVPFTMPEFAQRRNCWSHQLAIAGMTLPGTDFDALASRFRLTLAQIAEAVATACNGSDGHGSSLAGQPSLETLFAAARQQSGQDLAALARQIEPVYTWEDLILPEDALAQLRELCRRVTHRHQVLEGWGFNRKLSLGKGVNALFSGPSGTGKTMAAEVVANELGLDLYKLDLSGVVSKYIGETEKNLNRIFQAAENANAILFFDEADALFGKRSEVRDSHDRYANIEISYLLQKMEEYEGLSILATNLNRNMDEAFVRRLTFTIPFPFPDEAHRYRIWQTVWPQEVPLADDVDLEGIARQFKLAGGNIKNIALAAAFLAVEEESAIAMYHLLQATRREYQKMGKNLSEVELKGIAKGSS